MTAAVTLMPAERYASAVFATSAFTSSGSLGGIFGYFRGHQTRRRLDRMKHSHFKVLQLVACDHRLCGCLGKLGIVADFQILTGETLQRLTMDLKPLASRSWRAIVAD